MRGFFIAAIMALLAGLVLLGVNKEVAIGVLVAGLILGLFGRAAQEEENHRELVELIERQSSRRD